MAYRTIHQQRGAALVVALVLLVVVAFVGLAGISTTMLQSKATSNQYDREIAFQAAESGMQVAKTEISTFLQNNASVIRNCSINQANPSDVVSSDPNDPPNINLPRIINCPPNPFATSANVTTSIQTVASGDSASTFTKGGLTPMQPQFMVDYLGYKVNQDPSGGRTANNVDYGNSNGGGGGRSLPPSYYYRITARSCDPDPTQSACNGRAIVTLQSIYVQN